MVDDYQTTFSDGTAQQFITLVSKSGTYFYLIIDRAADGDQTAHFLNMVDEADLLALMDEEDIPDRNRNRLPPRNLNPCPNLNLNRKKRMVRANLCWYCWCWRVLPAAGRTSG